MRRSSRSRCWALTSSLAVALSIETATAQRTSTTTQQPVAWQVDTQTVRALLIEARRAALRASNDQRTGLLDRVGQQQAKSRDFVGAEETFALLSAGASQDARAVAAHRVAEEVLCGLLEERRLGDAEGFVGRVRSVDERSWLQGHFASQLAGLPPSTRKSLVGAPIDTGARLTRAIETASEIPLAEARLDAYLALINATRSRPTLGERTLRGALATLPHVKDPDRRSSRAAMLTPLLVRRGELDLARHWFSELGDARDREYVSFAVLDDSPASRAPSNDPTALEALRSEFLQRAVADARGIVDDRGRQSSLMRLRSALQHTNHQALAERLIPERLTADTAPSPRRSVQPSSFNRAKAALERRDFAAVRQNMSQAGDTGHRDAEARGWIDLAWETYSWKRDTAAAYLELARSALVRGAPDSAAFDAIAARIAWIQFWIGEQDAGIGTLNLVRSSSATSSTVRDWGSSTLAGLTAQRLREYANRVTRPAVRDQVFLRIITGYLLPSRSDTSAMTWASALADSIGSRNEREEAQGLVAYKLLERGDTTRARQTFAKLLLEAGPPNGRYYSDPAMGLEVSGGRAELLAWARGGASPTDQVTRRLRAAALIQSSIDRRDPDRRMWLSNGPDRCRDVF